MAKQTVFLGTSSNDGTGDKLRVAMDKIQDNTDEIYTLLGDGTNLSITGDISVSGGAVTIANDAIDEVHLKATNTAVDGYVLTFDSASAGFTWEQKFDGDITSIVAGDGLTGSNLGSGDATLNVNVDDSTIEISSDTVQVKDDGITNAKLADDAVDHDQLATRYTVTQTISTLTGSVTFNCANGSVFKLSGDLTGAYTIDLSNYKLGQIITIYGLRGNQTLNLDGQGSSTNTFNKIGADYEDNGTDYNIIQIECVDDSSTDPVFFYSISTYSSDSTDI